MRRAVVIGGGLAGMPAAAAVAPFADDVTIVERDALPSRPQPREGLPQAHHAHVLMSGGAKAMDMLLPGLTERWIEAAALKIPLPSGAVTYTGEGWNRRRRAEHYLIACSRALLDWHVRDLLLRDLHIRILHGTDVVGLCGSRRRVTGVRVASREGLERRVDADLVIDASGRHSRIVDRLAALGITGIPERTADCGIVYASRIHQAPIRNDAAPVVTGEPTDNPYAFVPFALQLPHPMIGQLVAQATPLTDVHLSRDTGRHRRYFEDARTWPAGLVVVGDAAATYHPAHGEGVSAAALHAWALRRTPAGARPTDAGLARRAQRAIARPTETSWALTAAQDAARHSTTAGAFSMVDQIRGRYLRRLSWASSSSARAAAARTQITTMEASPVRLLRPAVLLAAARSHRTRPLPYPPLTDAQRTVVNSASRTEQ